MAKRGRHNARRTSHAAARRTRHPGARRGYSSPACYRHELEAVRAQPRTRGVVIKRIYEAPEPGDGLRLLVDRLWPRGVSRQRAAIDEWLRDLAPSTALRRWFHRDPRRWGEFGKRYRAELRAHAAQLQALRRRARQQRITLLYAARDERINHAAVLREVLRSGHRPPR
jgi:uncharacterized protein YeaO (DUF488 family)